MTFYWWSHWFWITLLSNILAPVPLVKSYPLSAASSNDNLSNSANDQQNATKLFQTSTARDALLAPTSFTSDMNFKIPLNEPGGDDVADDDSDSDTDDIFSEQENIPISIGLSSSTGSNQGFAATEKVTASQSVTANEPNISRNQSETMDSHRSAEEEKSKLSTKGSLIKDEMAALQANGNATYGSVYQQLRLEREYNIKLANNSKNQNTNSNSSSSSSSSTISSTKTISDITTPLSSSVNSSAAIPQPSVDRSAGAGGVTLAPSSSAAPSRPQIRVVDDDGQHLPAKELLPPHTDLHDDNGKKLASTIESSSGEGNDNVAESSSTTEHKAPFTLENANKEDELIRAESEHRSRKSKVLSAEYKHFNRFINFSSDSKNLLARSAVASAPSEFDDHEEENISSEALSIKRTYFLDAGAISGICFAIFGICCAVATIGIVLYRRRFLNKPQALSEPDSSVYIDDSTIRDNSDEMYSLDNDSFLNSLEAMTIQNYWTDTVKHTKL